MRVFHFSDGSWSPGLLAEGVINEAANILLQFGQTVTGEHEGLVFVVPLVLFATTRDESGVQLLMK